jgi:hypothetical protein
MNNWRKINDLLPDLDKEVLVLDFDNAMFMAKRNQRYFQSWWTEDKTYLRPVHDKDLWMYRGEVEQMLNKI